MARSRGEPLNFNYVRDDPADDAARLWIVSKSDGAVLAFLDDRETSAISTRNGTVPEWAGFSLGTVLEEVQIK